MKELYLIRHTTPNVAKGVCYGQTDLDVIASFEEEAAIIRKVLPESFVSIHSSPLSRCAGLASHLFPGREIQLHPELMEIHCGDWEMKGWDDLPKEEVDPWMKDFVHIRFPGGESYLDLHARVNRQFQTILAMPGGPRAIVGHGGVFRSILSQLTSTPLIDSFKVFSLYYGCVIRVYGDETALEYEILSNIMPAEWEQHKPKSFYKRG